MFLVKIQVKAFQPREEGTHPVLASIPPPCRVRMLYPMAVVAEDQFCRRVLHLERKNGGVLKLSDVIARVKEEKGAPG
jgi:hypothetical protein